MLILVQFWFFPIMIIINQNVNFYNFFQLKIQSPVKALVFFVHHVMQFVCWEYS